MGIRHCSKPVFKKSRIKCAIQNVTLSTEEVKITNLEVGRRKREKSGAKFAEEQSLWVHLQIQWWGYHTTCVCVSTRSSSREESIPCLLQLLVAAGTP